jgi:hypothetical protein
MEFVPFLVREEISVPLTPSEVNQRLEEDIEPRWTLKWWAPTRTKHKDFEGEIVNHHFEIRRVIDYRNDFLPVSVGDIHPDHTGSRIELTFSLPTPLIVGIAIWLAATGAFACLLLAFGVRNGTFDLSSLVPLGMFLLGLIAPTIAFYGEVSKVRSLLHRLLSNE